MYLVRTVHHTPINTTQTPISQYDNMSLKYILSFTGGTPKKYLFVFRCLEVDLLANGVDLLLSSQGRFCIFQYHTLCPED